MRSDEQPFWYWCYASTEVNIHLFNECRLVLKAQCVKYVCEVRRCVSNGSYCFGSISFIKRQSWQCWSIKLAYIYIICQQCWLALYELVFPIHTSVPCHLTRKATTESTDFFFWKITFGYFKRLYDIDERFDFTVASDRKYSLNIMLLSSKQALGC